jgi:hypothetical protein
VDLVRADDDPPPGGSWNGAVPPVLAPPDPADPPTYEFGVERIGEGLGCPTPEPETGFGQCIREFGNSVVVFGLGVDLAYEPVPKISSGELSLIVTIGFEQFITNLDYFVPSCALVFGVGAGECGPGRPVRSIQLCHVFVPVLSPCADAEP